MQSGQPFSPVQIVELAGATIVEHSVSAGLCAVLVEAVLADKPLEDLARPVIVKMEEGVLEGVEGLGD